MKVSGARDVSKMKAGYPCKGGLATIDGNPDAENGGLSGGSNRSRGLFLDEGPKKKSVGAKKG